MEIRFKLKEALNEIGMSQKELAEKSGLRANAISEMVNNQRTTINREHAALVAKALDITDMNELFTIEDK
ncbi:helix-turn-helix transcriptional regulator [Sporosarcina sp. 6E9]|uniref:helix-turn-helix domain-containing protein n=1 Tax=Sporosarcina sp. 6E9 TaxID=2819235 RepID=UPI001B312AE1|nr:helix-turn-helix transcriptional regulator [Sporosarcina sp. 6E9]